MIRNKYSKRGGCQKTLEIKTKVFRTQNKTSAQPL